MKLTDLLNKAIAMELQATIQYMWQHILVIGKNSLSISAELKKTAMVEMQHAESLAERLNYLGVEPTTKPTPVTLGNGLNEMLKNNVKEEEKAIALYKEIIEKAENEKDYTTRTLVEAILAQEESHFDVFTKLLEK